MWKSLIKCGKLFIDFLDSSISIIRARRKEIYKWFFLVRRDTISTIFFLFFFMRVKQ